ncbi:MAG: aminopeptidase, partial [Kofleriaceae bacterium]
MPRLAATAAALAALASLASVAGLASLAGCGDNLAAPPDAAPDGPDLAAELAALPGVHDATEEPTLTAGYRYFVLHFTQPVDHADPAVGT